MGEPEDAGTLPSQHLPAEPNADWVVAGDPKGKPPEVGKLYEVRHSRKGRFTMRVKSIADIWCRGVIVEGVAKAIMAYNVAYEGDDITVRDSMSYFIPLPESASALREGQAGQGQESEPLGSAHGGRETKDGPR